MQYPNGSFSTHPQQPRASPCQLCLASPCCRAAPVNAQPQCFQTFSFSCAGNKASPTGPWSLPQHFDGHTNTPELLADKQAASLEEGAACVLRPQGSVGLEHSWNEGIKQALIQQSHCHARGACALPTTGPPPQPNCGVSECTCIYFPEGGSALPTEFAPCLLQVSALNKRPPDASNTPAWHRSH